MLLNKSGEDGSYHTYKYNENGQLVQSESAGVQYRYDYTPSGRVKTKYINNRPALSYEYTRGGKVSSITDISGKKTTYSYDVAGRMTSVKENDTILATYQYMDNDLLKEVTFANGISTKYEYDREQNLAQLTTTDRNGEILLSYRYQYDNNANRIPKVVTGITSMYGLENKEKPKATHYEYDCLQRISSVSYPEGKTESFVYDFAGNRIQKNTDNVIESYQYDICNRLTQKNTQEAGRTYQTTYKYDQQGSLLSEVGSYLRGINSNANPLQSTDNQAVIDYTKKYTYNDFHQNVQTEVIKGTEKSIQENIYDGEGLRYAVIENRSRTNFVTNGWSNFTELDENHHVKKRIIRGIGIAASEESASYHYYHGNERGDIEYITDQAGKAVNSYEYDAFGRITKAEELLQNRYTYNGEAYDQVTEQYYLRARYYNPTIARFTQEDVYRGDGLNLYAFCRNNAVMYVEPSGYDSRPGDYDYQGELPEKSWRLTPQGEGAHLVERSNVRNRADLKQYDQSNTPRYYPYGSPENAGQAHLRLHEATRNAGINLQGGNPNLSSKELMFMYGKAYADKRLEGIRGDLRTPNSKSIIGKNVTPKEAFQLLKRWGKNNKK